MHANPETKRFADQVWRLGSGQESSEGPTLGLGQQLQTNTTLHNPSGYIVADPSGSIIFATTRALRWLTEYFGNSHHTSLPAVLRDWLKGRSLELFNANDLGVPLKGLSFRRGSKRLTVESLSAMQSPDYRLVLSEADDGLDAKPLEGLGITKREAEVLLWVSQGKRNAEIAVILDVKPKTITKHLERVFEKLGVETRTSAANVALDLLQHKTPR